MHGAGLLADVFHDVDFAALGPADGRYVISQHPESRPHSLPCRNFDAGFKAAIGLDEKSLRLEPGGGVVVCNAVGARDVLFLRSDDEKIGRASCRERWLV